MKKTYVIIGGLWFDKANGNTYCNAKILETDGNKEIFFSGYEYGYGSYYMTAAEKYIRETLKVENFEAINGGSYYVTKRNLKNGWF